MNKMRFKNKSRKKAALSIAAFILILCLGAIIYFVLSGRLYKKADTGTDAICVAASMTHLPSHNEINTINVFNAIIAMKGVCALPSDPSHGCAAAASAALRKAGVISNTYLLAQVLLDQLKKYAGYRATSHPVSGDLVFFFTADGVAHHVAVVNLNYDGSITVIGNSGTGDNAYVKEQPIGNFTSQYPVYTFYSQVK